MKKYIQFDQNDLWLLRAVSSFAESKKVKLYLVGGMLRDLLLDRKEGNPDYDFCLKKGAINFGLLLARKIKAGFVVLDKEHGACRLVKPFRLQGSSLVIKGGSKGRLVEAEGVRDIVYTLDFTDFRGVDIKEDLLHRDFTMNAIAVEFKNALIPAAGRKRGSSAGLTQVDLRDMFIDPYGASKDIKDKRIRAVGKMAFAEDPLRVMRAFSFKASLGFDIDKETRKLLKKELNKLPDVSWERIRDELFKIFECDSGFGCLLEMDKLGILRIIFPEIKKMRGIGRGPYHHLDVWQHTLETIRQLELLIKELKRNSQIQVYLNEIISPERTRGALLKLGAFLHDIGKPSALRYEDGKTKFHGHENIGLNMTKEICRRIKLSNNEINSLKTIVLCHLRPGYLAGIKELTLRAKFRYFRDTGKEALSVLLLSIADQRATKGPYATRESRERHEKIVFGLIKEYFRNKKEKKSSRLLNGDDLIRKFKLEPSVLIGKILSEIEELQAIGRIKTRQEAFRAAEKFMEAGC